MSNSEFIFCTICGMNIRGSECVVYLGPYWPEVDCPSLKVSDQELTRYKARPDIHWGQAVLPSGLGVYPPEEHDRNWHGNDLPDGIAPERMYIAVHPACEDMAKRVMKTSSNAKIHSTGDLWLVLERRCASHLYREGLEYISYHKTGFIPKIPHTETGDHSYAGYYVPWDCLIYCSNQWDGWWDDDPVDIPNLTTELMSNLEKVDPSSNPPLQGLLESSPNEIKSQICSIMQGGELSLDCNYLMPQSMWAQVFFQIPFLWDLDTQVVYEKTGSSKDDLEKWNWEKLTRQVMRRVELSPDEVMTIDEEDTWSYSNFGLNVPGGLVNRRRIWQILEEMHPDVALRRDKDCHD
ncbi:hypothetical protein FSPOR_8397 [Fusarium sporotrichioides]|uniref:Uncharacterized protein n=1 Tax=Fusarium sporotrichioides TaxID=5514 RepID=A0A395RUH5_FUSSP|nr:hypothetical protein FSPOR_8397 [Fusarium sporotrichioides]